MIKNKLKNYLILSMMLLLSVNISFAFSSTDAEEEGYWYSRYNLGSLVMKSGMGEIFMPDKSKIMGALKMVDADFDKSKMGTMYGDNNHPMPPTNPAMLQAVYKSGDPHFIKKLNVSDFATQRWNPASFDKTLTGLANGFTIIKEVEWARQFHVDDHFGKITDNFGAQWRFTGMALHMEAKMQAAYFLKNKDKYDLSNGGDFVMLWAISDLGNLLKVDKLKNSDTNRYKNDKAAKMFLDASDNLFNEIKNKNPNSIKEQSLAIQSLVWYASATENKENKIAALIKIKDLSNSLKNLNPKNAAETAYSIRGLIEAKRTLGIEINQISTLSEKLFNDFNDNTLKFNSQNTYTIDDSGAIVGALNSIRIFESANVDSARAEEIFTNYYETILNKAQMQQSAPPVKVAKDPFEYEGEPESYFRYSTLPMPPMAGGQFGIAPVFANSVTYNNGNWDVDRTFDAAGSMHAANEFIWLHYDEINGFPEVDISESLLQLNLDLNSVKKNLESKESTLTSTKIDLANKESSLNVAQLNLENKFSLLNLIILGIVGVVLGIFIGRMFK